MDYDELVRLWCLVRPGGESWKAHMKREFMEDLPDKKKHRDLACLKCIEAGDLKGLIKRNNCGYKWECYKSLMMELCIVCKRWEILEYLMYTKQVNRDVNEAIARLATDDSWKCLIGRFGACVDEDRFNSI